MKQPTNSLERALIILSAVESTAVGMTNAESSRRLGIPKSTSSYIMTILERNGYLSRDKETKRYRIGLTPIALAHSALRAMEFRSIAEPILYKLSLDTGLSANLGVFERGRVLLVDRVESGRFAEGIVQTPSGVFRTPNIGRQLVARGFRRKEERDIGRELPCDASAIGNVLLAFMPRQEVLALIDEFGLERLTSDDGTSAALIRRLQEIKRQGYAATYGEYEEDLCAIAAPILMPTGSALAAVSVNGLKSEADWERGDRLKHLVISAAGEISRRARPWLSSAGHIATNLFGGRDQA